MPSGVESSNIEQNKAYIFNNIKLMCNMVKNHDRMTFSKNQVAPQINIAQHSYDRSLKLTPILCGY